MGSVIKRAYIEITNTCNLSCSFCRKNRRSPAMMSAERFEQVLKELLQFTKYIYLHVQGEPLLHPQFRTILEICGAHGARVSLVTNGSLLYRYPDLLSFPALHRLSVSLQSVPFHEEGSAEKLMETLLPMIRHAGEAGRPYIELRFWRNDLLSDPAAETCMQFLQENFPFQETGNPNSFRIHPYVFVSYDREFEWPEVSGEDTDTKGTCLGAREQIAVLSNGDVVPCCLDADGEIVFGNLFEKEMETILSSDRYLKMTEGFRNHVITEPLCRSCTFRRRFQ